FPRWEHRLRRQFQIHQLLRDSLAEEDALSAAEAQPDPEPLPARLGHYELLEELDRGGCGQVFRAWQQGLDREVAVKLRLPDYARVHRLRARFCQEARVMASLRHPHIMPVHEIGECQGVLFFSMDFMPAGSLAARLTGPRRPE